jgi:hypothetical protein
MIGVLTFDGIGENYIATVAEIRGLQCMHIGSQQLTVALGALEDIRALLDGAVYESVKIELFGRSLEVAA